MKLKQLAENILRGYLDENTSLIDNIDFNLFPKDVLKTLKDEYGHYYLNNFDWNKKQDEFVKDGVFDGKGFKEWMDKNEKEEFVKNIDKLITVTRQDLIKILKKKNADKVLKDFEELIIPVLGDENLTEPLSKFMEFAFLNLHSIKEIEKAYKEASNIIDADGSINYAKITPSTIFTGDDINLPKFENFVNKNPEYKGVFDDWKKMFDKSMEIGTKELNAFRSSTPYEKIRKLYDYLIKIRGKK